MRILVLAGSDLYRPRGGTPLYCYNRWRRIAQHHQLTMVLADTVPSPPDPGIEAPQEWCERVYTVPDRPVTFLLRLERRLRLAMPWKSRGMGHWMNREVRFLVRRLLKQGGFDLLHVEGFPMWWSVPRDPGLPVSFTATDVVSRFGENNPQPGDSLLARFFAARRHAQLTALEPVTWRRANLITTITSVEKDWISSHAPGVPVEVIPNGVDLEYFAPSDAAPADPPEICFTGNMAYAPNVDAVLYFCNEILLPVRERVPRARLVIVGRDPVPEIKALTRLPGVEVTGSVPDVRPYLRRATVVVAPVQFGAGMRGKHLEAMAMGKPVVATTFCVEGTACTHDTDILLADDAETFAGHTVQLLTDPATASRIAKAGRELIQREYNWDINAERLRALLEQCAHRREEA
jgi:glycosyltransferase involved in cell wall biosynthesis